MTAWRYKISLLVLKNISLVNYFSTLKEKFRISACPCNILYLLQFGGEISVLVLLSSDDPIQILVILSWFQMFRTETELERFVWSHWGIKVPISHSQIATRC